MTNAEIAAVFKDIAALLQKKNEDWFKIRAYLRVAKSIDTMNEPVADIAARHALRQIPGVGDAIEKKITELVNTGRLEYYEKLKTEVAETHDKPEKS